MPETISSGKGTAKDQLLHLATLQAQVQGKSLAQYLRDLQSQVERKEEGSSAPRPVASHFLREKYVYLTRKEVELLFEQITDLRDRAPFGCMYAFGLRASEAGILLREHINFRTRRVYISRLKGGIPGEKVMTSDIRKLLKAYKEGPKPCAI